MPNTDRRACKQKPLERSLEHLSHYGPHFLKTIPRPLGRRPQGPLTLQDHSRRLMQDHSKTIREGPFRDHPKALQKTTFKTIRRPLQLRKLRPFCASRPKGFKMTTVLRFETTSSKSDGLCGSSISFKQSSPFHGFRKRDARDYGENAISEC